MYAYFYEFLDDLPYVNLKLTDIIRRASMVPKY